MATRRLGIIMHGATSRIGTTQHLLNSLVPIRQEGGLPLANGDRLMPDPILVGRTPEKLQALAERFGLARWTTDFDAALADPADELFFECAYGGGRSPPASTSTWRSRPPRAWRRCWRCEPRLSAPAASMR